MIQIVAHIQTHSRTRTLVEIRLKKKLLHEQNNYPPQNDQNEK